VKTHSEAAFETALEQHLVTHGGYCSVDPSGYDRERALLPAEVLAFVEATQPKEWGKLREIHHGKLEGLFLDGLCKAMDQQGSLAVLRHGFKFYGRLVRLAFFAPSHGLNPDVEALYSANRLAVVRQVSYDPKNQNTLDLVLFLNGIPVVTAELKNPMTGQDVSHARRQYRQDRDPQAPIFRFKQRALVHFAVDPDRVSMTTRLAGVKTRFLPFDRGDGTAAGNPAVPGKHRTFYLWEEVWQRDSLLDLVGRFLHLQKEVRTGPDGAKVHQESLIFPRYHQLDAVRRLVATARQHGAGTNYLVQHSAGSGKSNTIAWLAHRLSALHDAEDQKVYHAVVVLTDRRVLDQQLQDTIYQFEHKEGVVKKVDRDSGQLAKALEEGVPILISTIHKFGFIQDKIASLPDRRYAVIVDEAHSSQSGEMAASVKEILSSSAIAANLDREVEDEDLALPDQLALRAALARGPQPNLSFFAFTATPKYKTLELFGHRGPDGKPAPFHLYSMRQAIEEGFILDVLLGYTTYKAYYQIRQKVAEDPELDQRKASKALNRFVAFHPYNLAQKTAVILEHFRECVQSRIGGRAKAMVVTSSREHAIRYKLAFDRYLAEKGYGDIRCLVAFSGELRLDDDPNVVYTEVGMNDGIKESELPGRFASEDYQVLLVANKYQTGFDQPLLHTMYVDKRLSGIQAVQTLSRLNRTHPGKEDTFVLDFVNDREEILASFQDYYEAATVGEDVDPQKLYELQTKLREFQVYRPTEVDQFARVFFKPVARQGPGDHARLNALLDPAVDRFRALEVAPQDDFRSTLVAYRNLYAFLAQVVPFHDADLEKLFAYGRMLLRKLPAPGEGSPAVELDEDVALQYYRLQKLEHGDLVMEPGAGTPLSGPDEVGTGTSERKKEKLSTLIQRLNERFGTTFDAQDLIDGVTDQLVADEEMQQAARVNTKENFRIVFHKFLENALMDRHSRHAEFIDGLYTDGSLKDWFEAQMLEEVYGRLKAS